MYSLSDVLDGVRNPYKLVRELNLLYHRRLRLHDYNHGGVDIFAEDWDNLILLDACRYDEFERRCDFDGRFERRESRGSSSNEFVRGNFRGRELLDTVCVTSNGWYLDVGEYDVHAMIPLVGEQYRDPETGTVLPETVTEHATDAATEYPNKRLVVHYMQPHAPYIGPAGRDFFEGIHTREDITTRKREGTFHREKLREAYRENLDAVLEEVDSLLDSLSGKTVISADHGEMLGERHFPVPMRDYMHPHGIDNDVLVQVPWFVCESGERRDIVAEPPKSSDDEIDDDTVEAHLKELGYLR